LPRSTHSSHCRASGKAAVGTPSAASASMVSFISNDFVLECPICVAELVSPIILSLQKADPSILTFTFPFSINQTHLSHFISVAEGRSVTFPLSDFPSYLAISELLGSTSLLFTSSILEQRISCENIIQTFLVRHSLHLSCEEEITSSHLIHSTFFLFQFFLKSFHVILTSHQRIHYSVGF
jgi:hypothetical protein